MTPRNTPRSYGSLERPLPSDDDTRPPPYSDNVFEGSSSSGSGRNPTSSFVMIPPPHSVTEIRPLSQHMWHKTTRRRTWMTVGLICSLVVVAITATTRAGTRPDSAVTDDQPVATTITTITGSDNLVASGVLHNMPGSVARRPQVPAPNREGVMIGSEGGGAHPSIGAKSENDLSFSAFNFYHTRDGKPGADYPWLKGVKIIEPFRETTLKVTNPRTGYKYRWSVKAGEGSDGSGEVELSALGEEVKVTLTKLDENVITLEEVDVDSGVMKRRLEENVMVKYVRREIRTLTDDERVELLNAMQKLWTDRVQGGYGKELHGDDYADIWAINRLHYKAASPEPCDHFHDGLGFLTNHALLSNTFEYSLQRVNPKLTLPYWDFTIESSTAGSTGDEEFEPQAHSPLLQPDWFGTKDPVDSQVKDGRWAFTEIPQMKQNNPGGIDADVYSKLRAPWNVNDRAYLTRGLGDMCGVRVQEAYPWPTCKMHYKLATEFTDFYSWVWYSLYDPHGPVHVWLGGTVDCQDTYLKIADLVGEETAKELAYVSFVHRKNLYRDGIFKCEGSVDASVKPTEVLSSGVCGCLGYDLSQGDDYKTVMNTMAFLDERIGDQPEDVQRQVVGHLCSGTMNDGDHLQASSSLDPTFWPSHPTMERLWLYTLLTEKVTDLSWPDADVTLATADGTTYTESISAYGETCMGHRGNDVFPFGLLESDIDSFRVQTGIKGNGGPTGNSLTNREVLQAFDPRENNLPYIYDTFQWTHCADDGYDMADAWNTPETLDSSSSISATGAAVEARTRGVENLVNAPGMRSQIVKGRGKESEGEAEVRGARTVFKKKGPRYPMYNKLKMMEKEGRQRAE